MLTRVTLLLLMCSLLCLASHTAKADVTSLGSIQALTNDNIEVIKLSSDAHASGFVIFIRDSVRQHRHNQHSETILVLEGNASMTLNDKEFEVNPGDYVHIPQGALHSVTRVLSEQPLKVLSLQAPEFFGKDREFVEP